MARRTIAADAAVGTIDGFVHVRVTDVLVEVLVVEAANAVTGGGATASQPAADATSTPARRTTSSLRIPTKPPDRRVPSMDRTLPAPPWVRWFVRSSTIDHRSLTMPGRLVGVMQPVDSVSVPSLAALRGEGVGAGLDVVEIASAEPFVEVRQTLERRKAEGLHGGMAFTYLRPARSTDPEQALPAARALVVGARSYLVERPGGTPDGPVGEIARYAWEDHYAQLKHGLKAVAAVLTDHGWRARVLADDNAMVDRAAAHRAGIGWWGKNANLLLPGLGSWYVLGSVVTDAPLQVSAAPIEDRCGPCTRCLEGCPTGAITAPGVVDARRCLSWLLQAQGPFPREHRIALGDRIYGCDECQEVCPPNRRAPVRAASGRERQSAPLLDLLDDDDAVVLRHADRWYIPKREVRYVRRNALVVLGNVGDGRDPEVAAQLSRYLRDPDPLLRAHAVWAARCLGREDLLAALGHEADPVVLEELAAPAP